MPGMKKLLFGALSLLLLTGCGASRTHLKVDPTDRTFAVLPVADYSIIEDVEGAHRQQLIVNSHLAAALATRGFPVSSQSAVYELLTDSGFIKPMTYEQDIKPAVETTSLDNLLNEDLSDMMKSEIVKLSKIEKRRSIPGIAVQDAHLPAPDTAILDRNGVMHLGRELDAEYILRGRLLVYDLRQEYPWDPLRRQILPFFQGRETLQQFGAAKAVHYDSLDNIVVGGGLTNLGQRNDHGFRLQLWLQDAVTGDVVWTNKAIQPIIEDEFVAAAAYAADELIADMLTAMAVDSDGDGVWDHRDRCPETPRGVQVDTFGCPPRATAEERIPEYIPEPEVIQEYLEPDIENWPEFSEDADILSVELRVGFDFDKAEIKPIYHADLEKVATFMKDNPETEAVIEGHTDEEGSEEYNMKLSRQRAESVKDHLVKIFEIDSSRLKTVGYGKTRPLADNRTPEGRQQNRRAEAVISTIGEIRSAVSEED